MVGQFQDHSRKMHLQRFLRLKTSSRLDCVEDLQEASAEWEISRHKASGELLLCTIILIRSGLKNIEYIL